MTNRCPTCNEPLPPGGQCEACLLVSAILLDGDDSPAPVTDPDDFGADSRTDWTLSPQELAFMKREYPSPATELPDPLPPPLADPLRVFGWYVLGSLALGLIILALSVQFEDRTEDGPPLYATYGVWFVIPFFLLSLWRVLPHRRTDVLYLRSFRHDENSASVRADLIRAFGPGVRVSGIRDPRRRSLKWVRQLNQLVFALRYATPKYLNLEAEDDWKARLWRSLTLSRGAILDVTDLTSYVKDEVHLCYRTLGLDRLLFVGNRTRTVDEWRELIAALLKLPGGAPIRIAIWSEGQTSRAAFRDEARAYAKQLPKRHPELSPAGSEIAYNDSPLEGEVNEGLNHPWVEVVVGGILAGFIMSIVSFLMKLGGISILVGLFVLWLFFAQIRAFFAYLVECGSNRERVLVSLTFGLSTFALLPAAALPSVQKVREAAARMSSSNNLKRMALAMQNYHDNHNGLPPAAVYDKQGKPLLSWRVLILPYIEQGALYKEFKLDEPWDSPHNLQLIERMPKVFRDPRSTAPPGYTHYRVFVTTLPANGPSAVFVSGPSQRSIVSIADGSSNTILIVEAKEAVPWTKPDELEYAPDKPLPKLGGLHRGVFLVAFADGSVLSLPTDLPDETLRALITANGGEVLNEESFAPRSRQATRK